MRRYCVYIASPQGYPFANVADEIALSLSSALGNLDLGGKVIRTAFDCKGRIPIVLLPQLLTPNDIRQLPAETILYNLEQVSPESKWITPLYLSFLQRFKVWDFDSQNAEKLRELGVTDVQLCPIGYVPELTRIHARSEDIEVLFYGSMNDRRWGIIDSITSAGIQVFYPDKAVYGRERDELIARAKIVLNLHYYESAIFEIVRVSYLAANRKCVVSETSLSGAEPFRALISEVPTQQIPQRCAELLADSAQRNSLAEQAFSSFSQMKLEEFLQPLLGTA